MGAAGVVEEPLGDLGAEEGPEVPEGQACELREAQGAQGDPGAGSSLGDRGDPEAAGRPLL